MAICPKCKKEITKLNYSFSEYGEAYLTQDQKDVILCAEGGEYEGYKCPVCQEHLFNEDEEMQVIDFLNGAL